MIYEEIIRLLRNPKWKYIVLILLASYGYYAMGDATTAVGLSSVMKYEDFTMSISMVPSFLCMYLLYHIAKEEEPLATWKTLLAFPIAQHPRYLVKTIALLLFQLPIFLVAQGSYYLLNNSLSMIMIHYSLVMQSIYFVGFLTYDFVIASGYLQQMGSVKIINVLEYLLPIFLISCILNAGSWIAVYDRYYYYIVGLVVVAYLLLLTCLTPLMKRKLFRELVLHKLFGTIAVSQSNLLFSQYQGMFDTILQSIFCRCDRHTHRYWAVCAAIEVSLKQNMFYFLLAFLCFLIGLSSSEFIFYIAGILCILIVLGSFFKVRKTIRHMCIKSS